MDSPVVQEALKQNVPRLALEKVIEHNLAFGAGDFTTVEELKQAVENLKARTAKGTNGTAAASQAGADAEKGDAAGPEGQNLCKVCLAEKCSVAFVPCGHIVCCPGCAETLTSCPVCRAMIQIRLRTYVP
ncbi:baculoviral IAP repeat-containing protein 8-like [Physella acuta]|uniref:baculoviral IAP repeat-containing protein 8-like n=1 Tax=Physella acuta TaxID=109671 RepID=UPI0027DD1120|nr:baculoviral IAP repeat-containing protein 8-like [Physella acuta]